LIPDDPEWNERITVTLEARREPVPNEIDDQYRKIHGV
jgi:hypothetical protein